MSEPTVVEVSPPSERVLSREFVTLLVTQAAFGMSFSAMFLMPKYLKLELFASDAQIGAVQAAAALSGVATFPLIGALNDRLGRKPFLTVGAAIMTLTALGCLPLRDVGPSFYLLRMLQGVAFALFFNSSATLTADLAGQRHMGRALALFGASMLATNALAPALVEPIAHAFGFDWMFLISTGFGVLSIALSLAVSERRAPPRSEVRVGTLGLLLRPDARAAALVMAATGAGFGTAFTFHQPYALALHIERVSGFFLGYAFFALVTRLGLMGYAERFGRVRVSGLCILLYALGIAATAFLRPGMLEVVGAMLGTAQGIFYPVFNAVVVEQVPGEQRGSMMALYHGGFNAGTALAMLCGGAFAEAYGYPALFLGMGAVTASAGVYLLSTQRF